MLYAQEPCHVTAPTATMSVPHVQQPGDLIAGPASKTWSNSTTVWMVKDCSKMLDYPNLKTEIRGFWSDTDLYLLFICPYETLNLWLPPQNDQPRMKLWDRDVVEVFLGDDWDNVRHYREFEIAPTADWIDLAIDLDHQGKDRGWRSGWHTTARIDERVHVWYAAAQIPLKSVSAAEVHPGTRWRINLYRIDGQGADPRRHFLCWQQTCAVNRDPNHVPENFGTLLFTK
jgi:Carbohydrate family 9 binding domain-like